MQSIQTKYLPPTNYRGSRIKATCERGSITIPYPHELSGDEVHREAARALLSQFLREDREKYGSHPMGNGWSLPFVTGFLSDGSGVHVFVTEGGSK